MNDYRRKEISMVHQLARQLILGQATRTFALLVALGLGGTLAGCADIHPEGNDVEGGMIDSPTDEADQFRQHEERQEEGGGRRN